MGKTSNVVMLAMAMTIMVTVANAADEDQIGLRNSGSLKQIYESIVPITSSLYKTYQNYKVESESRALDNQQGDQKLFFEGPGYTVNLIPHAIILGLLALGVVFLYGDALFGAEGGSGYGAPVASYGAPEPAYGAPASPSYAAPAPSYGAPSTGYDAANRYYDTYAQQAAAGLGEAK